jgi:hypothetical protein
MIFNAIRNIFVKYNRAVYMRIHYKDCAWRRGNGWLLIASKVQAEGRISSSSITVLGGP